MAEALKWILFALAAVSALVSGFISAEKGSKNIDKGILSITAVAFAIACIGYSIYMQLWWGILAGILVYIGFSVLGAFFSTATAKSRKRNAEAKEKKYVPRKGANYHDHSHGKKK